MEGLKSRAVALIVCLVLILVGWFGGSAIQAMNGGALITAKASGLKADTVVMQVGDADVTAGEYLYWLASVCDGFYQYYGISDWSMAMTADLTVGDYAVLVSDGLLVDGPGWVTKQLELSAAAGEAPEKVAKTLVETARVRAQKTGRPDDITAAVLRLEKCV